MSHLQTRSLHVLLGSALAAAFVSGPFQSVHAADSPDGGATVSYYRDVRPILQAACHGCHQPGKPEGAYVMTSFDQLMAGGESETAAVVPGKPDESYLLDLIIPDGGEAEMPKGREPLKQGQIDLIRHWIEAGAKDDTPESEKVTFDRDNPPTYRTPPVITSLDFSPDGQLLAVSGFHEVLLHRADGSELVDRLVGMSERIEAVRFSPDGKRLAVSGGQPGRLGELQVWDVEERQLKLSQTVTWDTLFGARWSPDGKLIAFGCTDNTVRAIEADTGKQVLYQGAHNDWPLDTVFSARGTHLISVGRDRTAKLTEVASQRFIDNITSITPGALPGGIAAIDRHPERDEVLVGGADGQPRLMRIFRKSKRVIGDNANLIREFPPLKGRIFGVAISPDGQRIVAGSSQNGSGEVRVYAYAFDDELPKELLTIMMKRSAQRSTEEQKKLAEYRTKGIQVLAETPIADSSVYAVAFSHDSQTVAAAGSDGSVRLINAATGNITSQFIPVPVDSMAEEADDSRPSLAASTDDEDSSASADESLPAGAKLVSIEVEPPNATIAQRFDVIQFVVTGQLDSGARVDLTRLARRSVSNDVVSVSPTGLARAVRNGQSKVEFSLAGQTGSATLNVTGISDDFEVDFVRDVMPILGKVGCNGGTCHGAKKGKGSLKMSLRGNDPAYDLRTFTDDLAGRRTSLASPSNSLMLLKASAEVPHQGGQLMRRGDPYYEMIHKWIADGAELTTAAGGSKQAKAQSIEILPRDPIAQRIGERRQFRVVARYADGRTRDVTSEAFLMVGNIEVAEADDAGLVTSLRRGEAAVLARYEGAYAATTLTVMGDRTGYVWQQPPANNFIDEMVAAKLQRTKTLSSGLCTDAEFVRRIHLDLTGLPPTAEKVRSFLKDERGSREKRDSLIAELIGSDAFVEHWTNKWADMLQVNRKFLGVEGSKTYRSWIRSQVADNTPYDEFVRSILTAEGSNKEHPPASYFKVLRTPDATMENTTQLFLAVRFSCNKCHDHPFERWVQDQYYETAAWFARVGLKKDPAAGDKRIGGTAVEGAKPLYEVVFEKDSGEVLHEASGNATAPKFPYEAEYSVSEDASRRDHIAHWITSPDNQYFAKSYVNRMWAYLLGVGFIEPIDDIRAGNPPTNPELLDRLTVEFIDSGFDARHLIRTICQSRTYQLSVESNKWNEDDTINYSHAIARRLPAEVLYDSLMHVVGSQSKFPGVPVGTRAAALPDSGVDESGGFLAKFGRPPRETACECERSAGMQFGPVMALVTGPTVGNAISDPKNELAKLVASQADDAQLVDELFLRILNRPATPEETESSLAMINELPSGHEQLVRRLTAYEKELAPSIAASEKKRQADIELANSELKKYEATIAERESRLDREHAERIAQAEASLKEYEQSLPEQLAAWESRSDRGTTWVPLDPSEFTSTSATTLSKQEDLSILATNSNGLGTYKIVASTDLKGITAVRLEALTHDRQPKKGPGRSPDGNFVLTEFELKAAPKADPNAVKKVKLENAQADFSQKDYGVATAIDGKIANQRNGWAIAPQQSKDHMASFETAEDIGFDGGTTLTFLLTQKFRSGTHSLGRFRLSVTTTKEPILLDGLPKDIESILAIAADKRSKEQIETLSKYYRGIDSELKRRERSLAEARKPRPVDPKLQSLRDALAKASKALPVDPKLARLRNDVALSRKQLNNQRLTAAQDIAWALINSSAFLFNR